MEMNLEPPTLSEVIRNIEELRTEVRNFSARSVSTEVYALDKATQVTELQNIKLQLAALQAKHEADEKARLLVEEERRKETSRNRWQVGLLIAGALLALYLPSLLTLIAK